MMRKAQKENTKMWKVIFWAGLFILLPALPSVAELKSVYIRHDELVGAPTATLSSTGEGIEVAMCGASAPGGDSNATVNIVNSSGETVASFDYTGGMGTIRWKGEPGSYIVNVVQPDGYILQSQGIDVWKSGEVVPAPTVDTLSKME